MAKQKNLIGRFRIRTMKDGNEVYLASTKSAKFVPEDKRHKTWASDEAAQRAMEKMKDELKGMELQIVKITSAESAGETEGPGEGQSETPTEESKKESGAPAE